MSKKFTSAALPQDEAFRLQSLHDLAVLDTTAEAEFDALVKVASLVCGKPIALISLIDAERQWFKADLGLGVPETPRDVAFCSHAILEDAIFEVRDTQEDQRFAQNPLVLGAPDIRFYAGAPIKLSNGARVGTLCVIDRVPGALTSVQRETLQNLSIAVAKALESRRALLKEQRHAQAEAKASQDLRALTTTIDIHAIVSETDRHGVITDINDAFVNISGYSRDELLGRNHNVVNSGVQTKSFWEDMWATISAGMPWRGEICNRSKSGQLYWVDSMIAPFVGDDGLVEKYVSIRTDITPRVLAQQQQEAMAERFAMATLSAGIAVWEWHIASNALSWDDYNYALYGRARHGGSEPHAVLRESVHPDDWEGVEDQLRQVAGGKTDLRHIFRIIWRGGEVRYLQTFAKGVLDANGRTVKLVGVTSDVTEIQRARDALLSSKQLLEESQAIAKVGGWELNLLTGVLFWTDETYRIHETSPDKFNPTVDAGVGYFLPDSREIISAALDDAIARGIGYDLELRTYTTQGRLIDVRTTCTPSMQDGKVTKLTGIFQDISERKNFERSLQEARVKAEQGTRAKGQFLANMSHEIRTPMNAILGMLTLLHKTDLTPQQDDYVSKTKGAANSLLGLLNDILDLSKVDAGKMTLDPQPFRLDRLMRDLAVILAAYVGNKPVEVLYDMAPELPEVVLGDAQRLQQVLLNLAGNAVKFTAQGEVVIRVTLEAQSDASARLGFGVLDSGIGIAPENQEHIFSGFSQAEASTTRKFGGTGLGLAISQELVKMMGGNIVLTSAIGHGSKFEFALDFPLVKDVPADLLSSKVMSAAPRRVLIVDDNATSLRLMSNMTRAWDWPTDEANSGEQALGMIQAASAAGHFPYDVVYVDWQMPGMDGWETVGRIRALNQAYGGTKPVVVMMSAHSRESLSDRTELEQSLLDGFLVKPVTASMVQEAALGVDSALSRLRLVRRAGANARKLTGMHILVVEDNLINQQVAEELLMSEGALVSLAANGQLGVDAVAVASPQFDVVLMDLQMPVMDGFAATRAIRMQLGLQDLPIVAMTANAMASDREACLAAGMTEHVGKPFDLPKLVNLLLRVSGRSDQEMVDVPALAQSADLPVFAGVDLESALVRMSGNKSLYVRSAKDFMRMLSSTVSDWQTTATKDRKAAGAQMHTLKGTAAIMGATELSGLAARLEKLCSSAPSDEDILLQTTQLHLVTAATGQAMAAVIRYLDAKAIAVDASAPRQVSLAGQAKQGQPDLRDSLDALMALLGASDLSALEKFAELRPLLEAVDADALAALENALQSLELEDAFAVCQTLRKTAV